MASNNSKNTEEMREQTVKLILEICRMLIDYYNGKTVVVGNY